jgi:hypothetical protein
MNTLIDKFETTISEINGSIMVHYRHDVLTGYCEYRLIELNNESLIEGSKKRFKQKGWILINTDMADVIEYIHSNSPLKSEDFFNIDKLIRDHSLLRVRSLAR